MSHKIRLNRLEKMGSGDRLWALIGIGKPRDAQHQRLLEIQARQHFYASGGNREAYLAFLPFDSFPNGFFGNIPLILISNMVSTYGIHLKRASLSHGKTMKCLI